MHSSVIMGECIDKRISFCHHAIYDSFHCKDSKSQVLLFTFHSIIEGHEHYAMNTNLDTNIPQANANVGFYSTCSSLEVPVCQISEGRPVFREDLLTAYFGLSVCVYENHREEKPCDLHCHSKNTLLSV